MGDPPVLIPNTVVKPHRAESTWLDTAREDMLLPDTNAFLAQSVEHSAVNRSVVGSSPTRGAKNPRTISSGIFLSMILHDFNQFYRYLQDQVAERPLHGLIL